MPNWKRIITFVGGAAPVIGSLLGFLPPWVGTVGGIVAGVAVNAEKLMAKRAAGAPTFDAGAAEAKVARMFPEDKPK